MSFENPFPNAVPNRVWWLLLEYFEHDSCFKSGSWPDAGVRHVQYTTRKGHVGWRDEGPFLCNTPGTTPGKTFGDRDSDEVGGCYLALDVRSRVMIEAVVAGVVIGKPAMWMRWACRKLKVGKTHGYSLRRIAFEKLAWACEEKGIS